MRASGLGSSPLLFQFLASHIQDRPLCLGGSAEQFQVGKMLLAQLQVFNRGFGKIGLVVSLVLFQRAVVFVHRVKMPCQGIEA